MRPRGCLKIFGVFFVLLIICCIVGVFVVGPRIQDGIADGLSEALSTEVSQQIDIPNIDTGTQTLDVAELEQQLQANIGNEQNVDDVQLSVNPDGVVQLTIRSGGQDIGYTGRIAAENGELQIEDMETDTNWLGYILPPDKLASAIENGVNEAFAAQGKQIVSVTPGNDEITFEIADH